MDLTDPKTIRRRAVFVVEANHVLDDLYNLQGTIVAGWGDLGLPAIPQELIDDMNSLRVHISKMCSDVVAEDLS